MVFARHGETAANRQRLALGRADPPLTERGNEQAAALAARLAPLGVATVYTSPLLRARATATAIADAADAELVVDDRLVGLDYGGWDQKGFPDLPAEELARWRNDPTFAPPGGESLQAVSARVAAFCTEMLDGPTIIAVSHVSPIKAAVSWALGAGEELGWRMFLEVASITRIGGRDGQGSLVGFNDTSHLSVEGPLRPM